MRAGLGTVFYDTASITYHPALSQHVEERSVLHIKVRDAVKRRPVHSPPTANTHEAINTKPAITMPAMMACHTRLQSQHNHNTNPASSSCKGACM